MNYWAASEYAIVWQMTGEEYIELIQYALKVVGGNETTAGRRGQKAMGVHALADELGRTFIVNAMSRGIAPNVDMKWTGHSDYKAMKHTLTLWIASEPVKCPG